MRAASGETDPCRSTGGASYPRAAKITTASGPVTGDPTAFMGPAEIIGVSDAGRVALPVRGAGVQVTGSYSARARSWPMLFRAGPTLGRRLPDAEVTGPQRRAWTTTPPAPRPALTRTSRRDLETLLRRRRVSGPVPVTGARPRGDQAVPKIRPRCRPARAIGAGAGQLIRLSHGNSSTRLQSGSDSNR